MNKIQLLKEPGYLYDLNFIFSLKFNTQLHIDALPSDDKKEENTKYFKEILVRFQDIPDDLYVFFHANETGRAFLPTYYFNPYHNQFATTYNFKYLLNELSDQKKLVCNLIKFYFPELDDGQVEECSASLNQIFSQIKSSEYSDEAKTKLYEFFIAPSRYVQLLQYELIQKEFLLADYYKDHYQKIIDLFNRTTFEMICDQMSQFNDLTFLEAENNVYVSYCLLNKFCISHYPITDGFLSLFGHEYIDMLEYIKSRRKEPDLCSFGTALCDESRVKILKILLERQEATCKDLEKEFSFSGSTAYHHINIMTKAGLLKIRNQRKTILYSINTDYVKKVIDVLKTYLKKRG